MARTVRTKVYKFSELTPDAQKTALAYQRELVDTQFIYNEAKASVDAFVDVLSGADVGIRFTRSWLEPTISIDDAIGSLKGLRLRTWLINNIGEELQKGRYYSLWSKTEVSYKHYAEGFPVLKQKYSKVIFDGCCPFTGVCYDESILQPIRNFIDKYNNKDCSMINLEELINDCFETLEKDLKNEEEAMYENTQLIEDIEANEREFYSNGKLFA